MGRNNRPRGASSRPSSPPPKAAPTRAAAPPPKAAPAPAKPTTAASTAHPPAPTHAAPPAQPQAPQPAQSGGSGLMGTIVASAAGSMAGSVIGHGISHAMFGGRGGEQQAAPAEGTSASPCADYFKKFNECLSSSNNQISECQWQYDSLQSCKRDNGVKGDDYY